jgi:sulfite exporter TauE/SafE
MTVALAILTASVLGSLHCVGMCGGFVCFYAAGARTSMRTHAAYNIGRLASYLLLGAMAGLLGMGMDRAGTLVGISRAAAVAAGSLMILWGASTLLALAGISLPRPGMGGGVRTMASGVLARARGLPPTARAATTGLVTTLLPCGWLYAFVAAAAATGNVPQALLVMGMFWLGTVPAMLAVGAGLQRLAGPLRNRLPALTATLVLLIGLASVAGRLRVDIGALAARPAAAVAAPRATDPHEH